VGGQTSEEGHVVDLVLEGAATKAPALAGAYAQLLEQGYRPRRLAGAAAGAVVATLAAIDFTPDEIRQLVVGLDFRRFEDRGWEDKAPLIEKSLSLLVDLGRYEGTRLGDWIGELLKTRGVRTFGDLRLSDDPIAGHRLSVLVTDLTSGRMVVLPRAAGTIGIEPDELDVALAVRMSMSTPVLFEPVKWVNPKTYQQHLLVDGSLTSSFPVDLFDVEGTPSWPTFGVLAAQRNLGAPLELPSVGANTGAAQVVHLLESMVWLTLDAHERLHLPAANLARTIIVPTDGHPVGRSQPSPEALAELYDRGRLAAEQFLADWDFGAYVAAYRQLTLHSRRDRKVLGRS
jgi:NTE family protein